MEKIVSQFVIIPKGSKANQNIYFNNDPEVNDNTLIGLQLVHRPNEVSAASKYYNQSLNFNLTGGGLVSPFFISLCDKNGDILHKDLVPFAFIVDQNAGKIFKNFYNKIDLSRSYIRFSTDPYPIIGQPQAGVLFNWIIKTDQP